MATEAKQEKWRKHIAACTSSGLGIQEWCKMNAIVE